MLVLVWFSVFEVEDKRLCYLTPLGHPGGDCLEGLGGQDLAL